MSRLQIRLEPADTQFRPGERVSGRFAWDLDERPEGLELHLFWYTRGKGTRDVQIVDSRRARSPAPGGEEPFGFDLPGQPYSCSGRLVSVIWAIELVVSGSAESTRVDITMSPSGREIVLERSPR